MTYSSYRIRRKINIIYVLLKIPDIKINNKKELMSEIQEYNPQLNALGDTGTNAIISQAARVSIDFQVSYKF